MMKKKKLSKNKKRALSAICIVAAIFVATLAMQAILDRTDASATDPASTDDSASGQKYIFSKTDYDKNIFEDEAYLGKNRYIKYTEGGQSTLIAEGDYKLHGDNVAMLVRYFDSIIYGDAEGYNGFFEESYFETHEKKAEFTMQMLYDIEIELVSSEKQNAGLDFESTVYLYRVTYKIMNNNGTFRTDMGSDMAVPELYEIVSYAASSDEPRINRIISYNSAKQ